MADNVEIQGLEFQIVNDSTQAVAGLQNLINTLNRLKTATNGGATGLSKTAQGIRELSNSLKGLNSGDASQKITRLTNALTALSQVGNVKISSSIANQLTAINTALAGLKWTDGDKLTSLANGLRPLSELGKANMTTFINQLSKLPKVIEDLEAADIDKFTQQMTALAAARWPRCGGLKLPPKIAVLIFLFCPLQALFSALWDFFYTARICCRLPAPARRRIRRPAGRRPPAR